MLLTKKAVVWASVWSFLAVAYFGTLLTQPPGVYDEGLIVCGASRILHGQLPYRDFDTGYSPAQFYTIAGIFKVFGASLLAERVWDTLWRLAIVGLTVVLAKSATPRQGAHPWPLICGALVTGAVGNHLYPMISGMLPCLAAVWCAVLYMNDRGMRWLFLSGIAAGVGVLYRHDLAACVCAAVMVAGCYRAIAQRERGWLQFPAIFCSGVLLVVAAPALYFWLSAPHGVLIHSFIDFPKLNFSARHVPIPGPGSILAWTDFYLPLAVAMAAAIGLRKAPAVQGPTLVLLSTVSLATLVLATQRLDPPHAYPAIIFSMVLLCACIAEWRLENRKIVPSLLLSGAMFCYGLLPLAAWFGQMMGLRDVREYSLNEPPNEIARAGPIRLALEQRQAIVYIQRRLLPGRPLYVGATAHGMAWYNDALFYFLADRPQATRFDMFVPGITNGAAVQSEIVRDLRQKQVEYVVLFRELPSDEPNLSSVDSGVRILDDAIRADYIQVAEFGDYSIWHRKNL